MAARKLTKRLVESLQPNPARAGVVWDTDVRGFGVAVSRGGVKSFVLNYRAAGGRERRYTIGRFGEWTVENARAEARQRKAAVGRGEDPLAERRARRQATDTAPTVADLAARVLTEHYEKKSASSRRNAEMLFRLYLLPALRSRPVAEVGWLDLDKLHRDLGAAHPFMANRMLSLASKAWALAARWGWYPRDLPNPAHGHDRHPEQARGRALDRQQLARLGAALDVERDGMSVAALRFCLLTGCRPGEALAARWEDVDLAARVWRLPAAKTGPRAVYLGQPAVEVLSGLARGSSWLFSGRGGADAPLSSMRALWERVAPRAELPEGIRLYDATRHTFATMAAELEVPRDVRQLLMGHAAGREAHDRYMHAVGVLLRAADLVAGELAAALRGEEETDTRLARVVKIRGPR